MAKKSNKVTATALAAHVGLTRQRVSQLANEGVFHRGKDDRYDVDLSRLAYIAWLQDQNRRGAKSASRQRLDDAKAREVERRLAREDGRLVSTEEALAFVDAVVGGLKSDLTGFSARLTRDLSLRTQIDTELEVILNRTSDRLTAEAATLTGKNPQQ